MVISDVLAAKGHRIVTVWATKRVDQIIKMCDERRIASVIVVDADGQPLGIVTDRLLLRALGRLGARALEATAAGVMESPVPSCSPSTTVSEALRRMTEERVRHLLVMDGDRMAGLVSIGDLVKIRLQDAEMESRVLRDMALVQLGRA